MKTLALLGGLAAAATTFAPVAAMADPVTLTWQMWSGNAAETAAWQHIADMVTAKYPDIKIQLQTSSFNDYWTKLPVLAASNQVADIVAMQSLRMKNFYSILEPLDEHIKADNFDIKSFEPSIIGNMQQDGATYALPYDMGPWIIYYNKDMFDAAKVPLPKAGWTKEDFVSAAKALTKDGKYGYAIESLHWLPFALGDGATYLKDDGSLDITNDKFVAATDWYVGLVTKDKVAAPIPAAADPDALAMGAFDSGAAAMYVDGPWMLIGKKQTVKFNLGLATIPAGSAGGKSMLAGSGFGVSASSQHKDEAWKALTVITSPEAEQFLAGEGRAFPARSAQQGAWYDVAAKGVAGARETLEYELKNDVPYHVTENWNQVENLLTQYLPLAFAGSQSAKDVLTQVQDQASQ